jgi:hypothetical protein
MSVRNVTDQSLAAQAASPETDHVGAGRSLIDEHQPRRIMKPLLANPPPMRSRHVSAMLLDCPQACFKGEAMTIEKTPQRATAARNPLLSHRRDNLIQGSVRLLGNDRKYSICIVSRTEWLPPHSFAAVTP